MKALYQRQLVEARILVRIGADVKLADSEGINPIDFIISKRIKKLLDEISIINGDRGSDPNAKHNYELPAATSFNLERNVIRGLNAIKNDAFENNKPKSDFSDKVIKTETAFSDNQLSQKIEELKNKTSQTIVSIEKLKARNLHLKKKLKSKRNDEANCLMRQVSLADPMQAMISSLNQEIESYITWIDIYKRVSKPFFVNVYNIIKTHILTFFNDNVKLNTSGSFQNGLIMPWSDLNLLVTFPTDQRTDSKRRGSIIENAKRFGKVLKLDKSTVRSCEIEERSSLLILKVELTKRFRYQSVEIIFKYYVNSSYPSNEEIIEEYLGHYPLAKPLYILFRSILHRSQLDDPSINGLKSVAIFLMVVAYLQHIQESNLNIGQLFINFLFFYSYSFNLHNDCVFPYPVRSQPRNPFIIKNPRNKIHSLMVVNPYNDEIILTKSFKRSSELKQLFRLVYISLFARCSCVIDRNLTVNPKRQPNRVIKPNVDDKDTDINEDPLDRFTSIVVRYLGKVSKKGPKLSLCLDLDQPRFASRGSFNVIRTTVEDLFEEELLVNHTKKRVRRSQFVLHTLFSYNYAASVNIQY